MRHRRRARARPDRGLPVLTEASSTGVVFIIFGLSPPPFPSVALIVHTSAPSPDAKLHCWWRFLLRPPASLFNSGSVCISFFRFLTRPVAASKTPGSATQHHIMVRIETTLVQALQVRFRTSGEPRPPQPISEPQLIPEPNRGAGDTPERRIGSLGLLTIIKWAPFQKKKTKAKS